MGKGQLQGQESPPDRPSSRTSSSAHGAMTTHWTVSMPSQHLLRRRNNMRRGAVITGSRAS